MNTGDTTWVLVSAALVLFMTPGLALFYGGMVRSKNVLSVMMHSFICMGLVTVVWAVGGFSLAFGRDLGGGWLGGLGLAGLAHMGHTLPGFHGLTVSPMAVMVFQMMFAVITAALISGGTVDRIRFSAFVVLIVAWLVVVYVPLAHWVFSPGGWLARRGVRPVARIPVAVPDDINDRGLNQRAVVVGDGRGHHARTADGRRSIVAAVDGFVHPTQPALGIIRITGESAQRKAGNEGTGLQHVFHKRSQFVFGLLTGNQRPTVGYSYHVKQNTYRTVRPGLSTMLSKILIAQSVPACQPPIRVRPHPGVGVR